MFVVVSEIGFVPCAHLGRRIDEILGVSILAAFQPQ